MEWTAPVLLVSGILALTLFLLVSERVPVDRTALGVVVILVLTGVLTPGEAIAGFANPAVITVAAMFLLSHGLMRTGAVGFIAERVLLLSRGSQNRALLLVLLIAAAASAFINNTPVVVLFIPIVMSLTCKYSLSPSKYLIPLSYASILAGTCTLIGTSTNIIVSDLSAARGFGELAMFELSTIGVPIALLGIALIYLSAPALMPDHLAPVCEADDAEGRKYLAEVLVTEESALVGRGSEAAFSEGYPSVQVVEVVRKSRILGFFSRPVSLDAGDLLLVKGSAADLVAVLQEGLAVLPHAEEGLRFGKEAESIVVELIVPPHSSLLGERLFSTNLQEDPAIQIIAIQSRGFHYSDQRIPDVQLRIGDMILVRCSEERLKRLRDENSFIILEEIQQRIVDRSKARRALSTFAAVVLAATSGVLDIMSCALAGVLFMSASGCLRLKDAYRSLQPDVLLLIVGTIALGAAMEKTGASRLYAKAFLALFHGAGPWWVLLGVVLLTSLSSQVLSNNASAVLILPIAISTALSMGVHPKPFIVGVCFGASASYATPIGYQTNLMVYGPGGYRFRDFLKLGIPLNLMVILVSAFCIPWVWPFHSP